VSAETAGIEAHPQPSPLWLELARAVAEVERRIADPPAQQSARVSAENRPIVTRRTTRRLA
jgi:hypothetical protein